MTKIMKWAAPAISFVMPLLAMADATFSPVGTAVDPAAKGMLGGAKTVPVIAVTGAETLNLICVVITWIFYLLIILAVVFVILAALKYMTAAGDAEKIAAANHQILYAAVAVVVALIARGFPFIIGSLFNVPSFPTAC